MFMEVVSALVVAEGTRWEDPLSRLIHEMRKVHLIGRVARSAKDALELVERERFDLAIVEHGADEAAYAELLHATQRRAIPAIVIADDEAEDLDERMLHAGASHFLGRAALTPIVLDRAIRYALEHNVQKLEWMRLALFDPTANVASRRMFDMRMTEEFLRARRCDCELALLLADVDDFKAFNDRHGHLAGDECLRRVGETLRRCVRRVSDLVARYGGEEFAAILPATSAEGALEVANRMVREVAGVPAHDSRQATEHVTISIGVATVVPDKDSTIRQLIARADSALYHAKRQGKNRATLATERSDARVDGEVR